MIETLERHHVARSRSSAAEAFKAQRYFPVAAAVADAAVDNIFGGRTFGYIVSGAQGAGKDVVAATTAAELCGAHSLDAAQVRMSDQIRQEAAVLLDIIRSATGPQAAATSAHGELDLRSDHARHCVDLVWSPAVDDPTLTPWSRTDTMRSLLQYLGHEARAATHPGYWTAACYSVVAEHLAEGRIVYLADGRFPTEVSHGSTAGLFAVRLHVEEAIRVNRIFGRDGMRPSSETLNHPGEVLLDQGHWGLFDLILRNDTDDEGRAAARILCLELEIHRSRLLVS